MTQTFPHAVERFRRDYGAHRAGEGRGYRDTDLLTLPYLKAGPHARQWAVRARTFDAFMRHIVRPMHRSVACPLRVLDLGAGNGWLSYRLANEGHSCTAVDLRDDDVDGLGAAVGFAEGPSFDCLVASFDDLPLASGASDLAVFNASLHYSSDLAATLAEARRVIRRGGCIAILDSPFYASDPDGAAMVAEKLASAEALFGPRAASLLALPFVEYLTRERLVEASDGLLWRRRRVLYPLWYELRPLAARLRGRRTPSRFDLWTARVS